MAHSLGKKIGIAALIMMGSVFLSRVIGLFRESTVAYIGGGGAAVDAYDFAFLIPDYLNHLTASGFFSITLIPIFSTYLSRDREKDGWRIFNIIFNSIGTLLLVLVVFAMIFTPELIELVTIITGERDDPAFRGQIIRMIRIILPAQLFHFAGGLFMAVQYAKEKFLIPALSPLIYNLGIIAGGLILGPHMGMEGFCWGVLAGAFLGPFILQMWGAGRVGMSFKMSFEFHHPDFTRYIRLTMPLMIGAGMIYSMEFLIKIFAYNLPEGSLSALRYSRTLMFIPVGLFGQAAAVASFPFLARLVAEGRTMEMNALINKALRYLSLVIPISIMMIVARSEMVKLIYERGQFNPETTELTAGILVFLLPGAFALSAYTVVVRAYYSKQNTLFPAVFGILSVIASLPVYWIARQCMGVHGVALAVSISVIVQVLLLYILWNRRSANKESRGVFRLYAKIILISVPIGILAELFRRWTFAGPDSIGHLKAFWICCTVGGGYCLLFIGSGYLLKIEEIKMLIQKVLRRKPLL